MHGLSTDHAFDFGRAPRRIYWEVTRACSLACRHCRAEASPNSDPDELSSTEGRSLIDRLASFGEPSPHLVLTGGDPLERADLFDLIAYARSRGLAVSVSPSATPRLTPEVIHKLKDAGVDAISLSIDGASAQSHDAMRGVPSCFERTLAAGRAAAEAKLMVQVNTLVAKETLGELEAIHALACQLGVARWSLFFLVSVGRGTVLSPIDAEETERVLQWLADRPRGDGFPIVTTTEAPHFRRIVLERKHLPMANAMRGGFGIRDGNGVMFISHTGDVSPSGFLPLSAGNVRAADPVEMYRDAPLFTSLRHAGDFGGRCGICSFHSVCGGSRARAFAATGDPLAEDPLCSYQPPAAKH
ncbi:MAG: radical SAM protein [Myxococcales bacterium]|nr:radical SAM protein [Myxococcales bacterium]